jgi:hypothetical protein
MHQKTPVFLIKYCHNKDLKKIELRISVKISESEAQRPKFTRLRRARILMAKMLMTKTNLP